MSRWLTEVWQQRLPRERRAIGIGAVLVFFAFAYAYAWLPMSRERETLARAAPAWRAQLLQTRQYAAEITRLQALARPASTDLPAILKQSAATPAPGKNIMQIDAEGAGRARVRLSAMRSADWFAWVALLQSEYGVRIETVRMQALEDADMVAVDAVFAGGG